MMSTPAPRSTPDLSVAPARPGISGRFGAYGGRFVPETLVHALDQLEREYALAQGDTAFQHELAELLRTFVGRPTPLYQARRLSERTGAAGVTIWLKREDLAHTGAHKINNTMGQALLTRRMGKKRVIAETGAGQHGVATATAAAHFGLSCDVYMGAEDVRRQRLNVVRMRLLGANVNVVNAGSRTLKDATNEAMRDWMGSVEQTHYILGSVVGPHPFPTMVRDFQSVIGRECREQCLAQIGRLPDAVIACVGGGSNAAGMFHPFMISDEACIHRSSGGSGRLRLVGVEAGGRGTNPGQHAATLSLGAPGVLHGSMSYVLQSPDGQTAEVHSISAGLDYPGVGPEHSYWKDAGLVEYVYVTDREALEAFEILAETEGIIPALESAHAVAHALKMAGLMKDPEVAGQGPGLERHIIINLSGRGDKDVDEAARLLGRSTGVH